MRYLVVLLLISTAYAHDSILLKQGYNAKAIARANALISNEGATHDEESVYTSSSSSSASASVSASTEQRSVKSYTQGSMKTPYKTITLDIYQETDVNIEQRQAQIALLIAKLKQLQETKVTVKPKFKVVLR